MPPTHALQCVAGIAVSVYITLNLGGPIVDVALWHPRPLAPVPVPKATINEEGHSVLGEEQVRRAGQVFSMQAKAIARAVELAPDFQFRSGAFRLHSGHDAATVGPAYGVGHRGPLEISRRCYQQRAIALESADLFVVLCDKFLDAAGEVILAETAKLFDVLSDEGLNGKYAYPVLHLN